MMGLIAGLLGVAGIGWFAGQTKRGQFPQVPVVAYLLGLSGVVLGLYHLAQGGGAGGLLGASVCTALLIGYTQVISRRGYRHREDRPAVGDRFPDFTLPDSEGNAFRTSQLFGQTRALYIFYRGDW